MTSVTEFIEARHESHLAELAEFLAIPSVSALPEHAGDVQRCAEWMASAFARAGLEHVRLIETAGNPIVYGDWMHAPGAPTILCYGHYDVQPVDPIALWISPPFEATVRHGKLYARGATDDKGQLFIHLKAIEAYLCVGAHLPVNIRMLVEGEEEIGGRNLIDFVRRHAESLAADVAVISDTAMLARDVPSLCEAMRGIACFQIDLRGTSRDLHSGSFGGAVANPAIVLAHLIARLKDASGRVTIPRFYDDVRPLTDEERAELSRLPFDERQLAERIGAPRLFGEPGYSALERMWARPTLEINGIDAGFTGAGFKTVIPAVAMAKISMRLVPDQDPTVIADCLEEYARAIVPDTAELRITRLQQGRPWAQRRDDPFMEAAARAMGRAFGATPVFAREGGGNSVVSVFETELGTPTIMFGIGSPDDNAHAPDEHLDLASFHRGIIAAAELYEEIAGVASPSGGFIEQLPVRDVPEAPRAGG